MSYQRRKYRLTNLDTGSIIELDGKGSNNEPKGWDNSEKTWKRSEKDFSFTFEFSKDLQFTGSGATFLRNAYAGKDIEASVEMTEFRFNPDTDEPYVYSIGLFDFSQYSTEKTTVNIPFKSGGLRSLLKSKLNNKFELGRTESINGNTITPLETKEFAVINRPLDLNSRLETSDNDRESSYLMTNNLSNDYNYAMVGYPLEIKYESDDNITSIIKRQASRGGGDALNFSIIGARAAFFYDINDITRNINVKLTNFNFDFAYELPQNPAFPVTRTFKFGIMRFKGAVEPLADITDPNHFIEILDLTPSLVNNVFSSFSVNYETNLTLEPEESLSLGVYSQTFGLLNNNVINHRYQNTFGTLDIKELSVRNELPRRSKCALNKDIGNSLMKIITGEEGRYYSEYFSNGDFKLSGGTTGKWIRGFLESQYTTSFKEFADNSKSLFNMGYNIEFIQGKEVLVHEPLKYFFQNGTVIRLENQVNNVKRSVANSFIFSSIKSGYKKPSGDNLYEEVNGLNEVNTSNEYTTPITRVEEEYDIESPYRADSEGKELTLRQSIKVNPTGDYRTDNNIFNLDLKDVGTNVYEERIWSDDYELLPESTDPNNPIFSPQTLTGLRFTPYRNMERHFWLLKNAYTKQNDKYIRYSSTRGNSDLITKKAGDDAIAENGKYLINDIENPLFLSQWIEFEHEVKYDVLRQLEGVTNVNGRDIPNLYFKIEFINEFNNKEYGYLFDLKPNKQGKWKVLKAL